MNSPPPKRAVASRNGLKLLILSFNSKISIIPLMILILDILHHYFIRHIPTTTTEVPPCPDMSAPKLLAQMGKFLQQFVCRLSLQPLHQSANRYLRRNRHKQMNMIFGNMPFENRYLVLLTNLTDQLSHSQSHFSTQGFATVLSHPHQVQVYLENRMSASTIVFHAQNLSYLWVSAEAFA